MKKASGFDEPEINTKNGVDAVEITAKQTDLVESLLDNPCHKYGIEIDLIRSKDTGRPTIDVCEIPNEPTIRPICPKKIT